MRLSLVVVVVDDELRAQAHGLAVAAQDAGTDGVERAQRQVLDGACQQDLQPLSHLPGRLVGERHRHDAARIDAHHLDQIGDAVSDDPGLAAAGTGQDEERPLNGLGGCALSGIKTF